jgi:transcriptional regulator with XRE-family HTH domain
MSSKQNVGKIIREQRKSIPLTLKQLYEMSGVSITYLARIEKGET